MLYLSTKLYDIPLLSIRSGGRIGTVIKPIINPHNLHVDGFYCQAVQSNVPVVLLDINVRDISPRGIIIDDHVDLSTPDELVRLKPVLDMNYGLEDKAALVNKKKIGKIIEFAIDSKSLFIQKLYVQPRVWGSLKQDRLTFDRQSIIEVTDTYVSFKGPEVKDAISLPRFNRATGADYSANASTMSE
ncbi:MAG: hypothetical protein U0491_01385 [Candidatus Saccharimonadales bacterium]